MDRGESGPKFLIEVALIRDKWQVVSGENQESIRKLYIKSEVKKGVVKENYLEYCLDEFLFHFGEFWPLKS